MRIARFTIYRLRLPLRHEIKHASAARHDSTNLLVACQLADGTIGWGEGVPRQYVTGETPDGAVRQLAASRLGDQLSQDCESWSDVIAMCDPLELAEIGDNTRGSLGHAARCAVELSVLDAFGQRFGEPLSRVAEHFPPAQTVRTALASVRYSGAVTASSPKKERLSALKMRLYGFRHCKVKVGLTEDEAGRLSTIRRWLGWRCEVRVDANEAWSPEVAMSKIRSLIPYRIACVEQPVPHADVSSLAAVRDELRVPIMLDESLTSLEDARRAIRDQTCDLFNIRLSKCGGYLRSLRLAALAHEAGLQFQLGCHPGESGVLSAAGRHWSTTVRGIRFVEGSYDRHLLRRLLTREDITFGYGGRAPALVDPGLGVTIDPKALNDMADERERIDLG